MASFATAALLAKAWLDAIACLLSLMASLATAALFVSAVFCEATDCKLSLTADLATAALSEAKDPAPTDCKLSLIASLATFALFASLACLSKAGSLEAALLVFCLTLLSKLLFLASNLLSLSLNSSTTFCKFSTRSSIGAIFKIAGLFSPPRDWMFLSASEPLKACCKFGSTFISKPLWLSNSCVALSWTFWMLSLEPKSLVTFSVLLSIVRWIPTPTSDWSSSPSTTIPFCSCWLKVRTCSILYSKLLTSKDLIFFNSRTS